MSADSLTLYLEDRLQEAINKKHVHHAVMALASGDGSFYWKQAYGHADDEGRPMTADIPFFIASITKLFIATSVFILRDRKLLNVHDPLTSLLPASITSNLHLWKGTDVTSQITPMHLLCHASGLPDWLADKHNIFDSVFEDRYYSIQEVVDHVKTRMTPHFPPSDVTRKKFRIRYSDTGYQLLIAIVETMLQTSFSEACKQLIFAPAGLAETWQAGIETTQHPRPAVFWDGPTPFRHEKFVSSTRDLYSTCDDLLIFYRALQSGRLFERIRTRDDLQHTWNRFGFPGLSGAIQSPGWPIEYAAGTMRFRAPALFRLFNSFPELIGHTGATGSWLFYNREHDLYTCGSVSQTRQAPYPFRHLPYLLKKAIKKF